MNRGLQGRFVRQTTASEPFKAFIPFALPPSPQVDVDIDLLERANLADVDVEKETLRMLGKGRLQKETLTMPKRTREIPADWIAERGSEPGPLFVNLHHEPGIRGRRNTPKSLYRIIRDLGKRTDRKVRPHGLRHTAIGAAVGLVQAVGMGETKVLQFSRHTSSPFRCI